MKELNERQKLFCKYYVSEEFFGNGVKAYCKAYGFDSTDINDYNVAKVMACGLLKKHNIISYIDNLVNSLQKHIDIIDSDLLFLRNPKSLNLNKGQSVLQSWDNNQFEIENGLLTVNDKFLKNKSEQSKHTMWESNPDTIYVININGTNIYKIGISKNHKRRIKDIRQSMPFNIDVLLIKKSLFAYELEQSIHEEYKDYHIKNEWFKINDIKKLLNKLANG
jgi:hypothetical protein